MPKLHSGSCLCGAARFEVEGDFDGFYLCHCGRCRKGTGSAHGANLFSATATLKWLAGEAHVTRFDLPGARHARAFCAICGAAMPRAIMGGAAIVVPAGALDSEAPIRPTAHIFIESRAGWDDALEKLPAFEGFPEAGRPA